MRSNIEFEINHVEIVNKIDKIIVRKHFRVINTRKNNSMKNIIIDYTYHVT